MKRFMLMILTVSLIVAQFAACSKGGEETKTANIDGSDSGGDAVVSTTEDDENTPDLPDDANFGGYEFRVINTLDEYVTWLYKTLIVEEETGEALNDAIYKRNSKIEEQYGFKLVQIGVTDPEDGKNKARTSILANTDEFDLLMGRPASALTMAQEGLLLRIDEIPYVDLSKPYWDQDMNRDFSIDQRLYFTSGDFSFNQYTSTIPMFFNKKLLADLGLEDPYQLVKSGDWTIDKFAEMAKAASKDINGDQQMTLDDQWGFVGLEHNYTLAFMCGSGAKYVTKGSDDIPYCTIGTEEFINTFDRVYDVMHDGSGCKSRCSWTIGHCFGLRL